MDTEASHRVLSEARAVDGRKLTVAERYQWVQRLTASGMTYEQIASELGPGWHKNTICYAVKKLGPARVPRQRPALSLDRQRLVEDNLSVALKYSWSYARKFSPEYRDDFRASALLGLCEAAQDWDPDRGVFNKILLWHLRNRLICTARYVASLGFAPVRNSSHPRYQLTSLAARSARTGRELADNLPARVRPEAVHELPDLPADLALATAMTLDHSSMSLEDRRVWCSALRRCGFTHRVTAAALELNESTVIKMLRDSKVLEKC